MLCNYEPCNDACLPMFTILRSKVGEDMANSIYTQIHELFMVDLASEINKRLGHVKDKYYVTDDCVFIIFSRTSAMASSLEYMSDGYRKFINLEGIRNRSPRLPRRRFT